MIAWPMWPPIIEKRKPVSACQSIDQLFREAYGSTSAMSPRWMTARCAEVSKNAVSGTCDDQSAPLGFGRKLTTASARQGKPPAAVTRLREPQRRGESAQEGRRTSRAEPESPRRAPEAAR